MIQRRRRGMALTELACLAELFLCLVSRGLLVTSQALYASYDSSFTAPACLEVGSSCQTDDYMIAGVGTFETNAPNTVDNCTDSSNAVYQQDEYINRIIVRSKYSGPMTAGDEDWLEVHATVRLANDVSGRTKPDAKEIVHIFYASESIESSQPIGVNGTHHFANAHWKWICSKVTDPGAEMAVFSCDFQIPEGNFASDGIQAVRVNYGFGEYAIEACTTTPLWDVPYSDVDDLVFRVAPPPGSPSSMPSQSPSIETTTPASPVEPAPSNYRFFCAETFMDAREQCLDSRPCPMGTECESGSRCFPVHCTDCPDISCIDETTSSPTERATLAPPSESPSTNAPTTLMTYFDKLPPNRNSASSGSNCAWFVGLLIAGIMYC